MRALVILSCTQSQVGHADPLTRLLQDRPNQTEDVRQTRQLHLMQQELGIMRQHLFPADRILGTLLNLGTEGSAAVIPAPQPTSSLQACMQGAPPPTPAAFLRGASSRRAVGEVPEGPLLSFETVDFLEEVQVCISGNKLEGGEAMLQVGGPCITNCICLCRRMMSRLASLRPRS